MAGVWFLTGRDSSDSPEPGTVTSSTVSPTDANAVTLPANIVGRDAQSVSDEIVALGVNVDKRLQQGTGKAENTVVSSDPEGGSRVEIGSTVVLYVAWTPSSSATQNSGADTGSSREATSPAREETAAPAAPTQPANGGATQGGVDDGGATNGAADPTQGASDAQAQEPGTSTGNDSSGQGTSGQGSNGDAVAAPATPGSPGTGTDG